MTLLKKAILFTLIFIISFSSFAFATNENVPVTTSAIPNVEQITDVPQIPKIIQNDVYKFDDEIVFDELVDGNAFLFGSKVTVKGEVNGDLAIFGDEVVIEENAFVYSSLYVFANKLTINGVCNDLYAFSKDFTMGDSSYVYRDLNLAANSIVINGYVNRNANILAQSKLELNHANGPTILGNLNYTSPTEFTFNDNAVRGTTKFTQAVQPEKEDSMVDVKSIVSGKLLDLAFIFIIFLLASWLTPKFVKRSGEYAFSLSLLNALWIGIVATILLLIGEFTLLFFLPKLAFVFILLTIAAVILTAPVFALALTSAIVKKANIQNYGISILVNIGVAIAMILLTLIPVIGWILGSLYYILGLGLLILYLFDSERLGRKKDNIKKEENIVEDKIEESKDEKKENN